MTFLSEFMRLCDSRFENHGFDRAAFIALLGASEDTALTPAHPASNWDLGLYYRQWFSFGEAACIIEGIDPSAWDQWPWNEVPPHVSNMLKAIVDGADELDVETDGCSEVRSYDRVSHQSIAAWCSKRGIDWPLRQAPKVLPIAGATDAASLAQRLAEAELKAERLAQELATITAERDKLSHELQGLTDQLVSAKKEAAKSKSDLQEAEADLLRGKARGTMLRLVGGMAALCGVTIHGERIDGLKYITEHLDKVGASVGDDTTRKILREAAQLIPPPKPRQP